jgi:hypothetical protein
MSGTDWYVAGLLSGLGLCCLVASYAIWRVRRLTSRVEER